MSPRVRPDMRPANATSATHMTRYTQNIVSQHGTSLAAILLKYVQNKTLAGKHKSIVRAFWNIRLRSIRKISCVGRTSS